MGNALKIFDWILLIESRCCVYKKRYYTGGTNDRAHTEELYDYYNDKPKGKLSAEQAKQRKREKKAKEVADMFAEAFAKL